MGKKYVEGTCHICGCVGKLTFEHVPPEKAFNDRSVRILRGDALINADLDKIEGPISQRGCGAYTLCGSCNSNTGSWYGRSFIDFASQGMQLLYYTRKRSRLNHGYHIFPLRVLKQVVCMLLSVNSPNFRQAHPELEKFVLDKEHKYLDTKYRIFSYLNTSVVNRMVGCAVRIRNSDILLMSEMSFPPFGFVVTVDGSDAPDPRLTEITFMSGYNYFDRKELDIDMEVLPIYTFFPGDYRDRATVRKEAGSPV